MRSGSVSMPCRIWNAVNGAMHAPKSRMPSRRARSRNARRRRFLGEHHVVEAARTARSASGTCRARASASQSKRPPSTSTPPIDDAVAGQELGRRVVDEVGAVRERLHQIRRRERRVDEQRQPVLVRELPRRAGCRARRDPGCRASRRTGGASRAGSPRASASTSRGSTNVVVDAEARQRVVEQVVRAAVERARRDDVRAGAHAASTIARCSAAWPLAVAIAPTPPSSAAMRSSSTAHGRIGDARIDVARALHVEQRRRVVGVAERRTTPSGRSASRARRSRGRAAAPACSDSVSKCGASWAWCIGAARRYARRNRAARRMVTHADAAASTHGHRRGARS